MTKHLLISLLLLFISFAGTASTNWKAKWISSPYSQSQTNTWIGFRKQINIDSVPEKVIANIGYYGLWDHNFYSGNNQLNTEKCSMNELINQRFSAISKCCCTP